MKPRIRLKSLHCLVVPHPVARAKVLVYSWACGTDGHWYEHYSDMPPGDWPRIETPERIPKKK